MWTRARSDPSKEQAGAATGSKPQAGRFESRDIGQEVEAWSPERHDRTHRGGQLEVLQHGAVHAQFEPGRGPRRANPTRVARAQPFGSDSPHIQVDTGAQ